MEIWPATLPTYPQDNEYTENATELVLRPQPDIGPPKMRKRSTTGPSRITADYIITATELNIFKTFFLDSIKGGEDSFEWPHPRLERNVEAIFITSPTFSSMGYDLFKLSIELEIVSEAYITGWFVVGFFRGWF